VKFGEFRAADLSQFLQVADSFRFEVARVSGTPLTYFLLINSPPSGESLKVLESRFIKKCLDRQKSFGNTWGQIIAFAVRIKRGIFEPGTIRFKTEWANPAPESAKEAVEVATGKAQLGVPRRQILRELGYTNDQIKQFEDEAKKVQLEEAEQQLKVQAALNPGPTPEELAIAAIAQGVPPEGA
jgi:hypothetical protein